MPILNWLGGEGQPEAIAAIISYKSVSTGTITRDSGTVAAKTVRLETLSGSRQTVTPAGQVYSVNAFVLGEIGTDLRPGDRFTVSGQTFEVIMLAPGHIDCEQYDLFLRR